MSVARARQVGSSSSGSTTRFTRPHSQASAAVSVFPVKESSLARAMPIKRGSLWLSPQPGRMPTRACVSANFARLEAMIMSQARASSKPPVTAWPLTAAMMGPSKDAIASTTPLWAPSVIRSASLCPSSLRSKPAQKARPAPVRTATRIAGSAWISRKASVIAARSALESAFIESGRFSVRLAIASFLSRRSTSEDIPRSLQSIPRACGGSPGFRRPRP